MSVSQAVGVSAAARKPLRSITMQLPNLMELIGSHADSLTAELLADISSNPRTLYLHGVLNEELRDRVHDVYQHLDRWLGEGDESKIDAAYGAVAARQQEHGTPLSELVYALILVKQHLFSFIRRNDPADTAMEKQVLSDLTFSLDAFFDKAIYHATKAYEKSAIDRAIRGASLSPDVSARVRESTRRPG